MQARRYKIMDWVFSLIPDISLSRANQFYTFGWAASLTGAAITFAGVIFLMWGTRVRDHDFESQMTSLNVEAATARERAGKLEARAAGLENETAKSKERTAELQRDLDARKNRTLTHEQKTALIERLTPLQKGKIIFNPLFTDGEATQFSDQIKGVLKEAGYEVEDMPLKYRLMSLNRTGAFLWVKDGKNPPERAKNIATAFRLIGIEVWGEAQPDIENLDTVMFVVGAHP